MSAKLSALPPESAGLVGAHGERCRMSRHEVLLSRNIRRPEAVNDVGALQLKSNRLADGNVNLVCIRDDLARSRINVGDFPPPLMADQFDDDLIGLARQCAIFVADDKIA